MSCLLGLVVLCGTAHAVPTIGLFANVKGTSTTSTPEVDAYRHTDVCFNAHGELVEADSAPVGINCHIVAYRAGSGRTLIFCSLPSTPNDECEFWCMTTSRAGSGPGSVWTMIDVDDEGDTGGGGVEWVPLDVGHDVAISHDQDDQDDGDVLPHVWTMAHESYDIDDPISDDHGNDHGDDDYLVFFGVVPKRRGGVDNDAWTSALVCLEGPIDNSRGAANVFDTRDEGTAAIGGCRRVVDDPPPNALNTYTCTMTNRGGQKHAVHCILLSHHIDSRTAIHERERLRGRLR